MLASKGFELKAWNFVVPMVIHTAPKCGFHESIVTSVVKWLGVWTFEFKVACVQLPTIGEYDRFKNLFNGSLRLLRSL